MKVLKFEGTEVNVQFGGEGSVIFDTEMIAKAVGYQHVRSLYHHTSGTKKDIVGSDGKHYMDVKGLKWLAKRAYRTPALKRFAGWAAAIKIHDIAAAPKPIPVNDPKVNKLKIEDNKVVRNIEQVTADIQAKHAELSNNPKTQKITDSFKNPKLFGITEASFKIGMNVKELSDWLVEEGYAGRYTSNNNLFWKRWFKEQQYGTTPTLDDEQGQRHSNIAKLTIAGLDFVKKKLDEKRAAGVMAFAQESAEKEVDDLIRKDFSIHKIISNYNNFLNVDPEYRMTEDQLLARVKGIIAQIKLKEKV